MEGREEQQQQQQKPTVGDRWKEIQGERSWDRLLNPFDPILKSEILRYGDFAHVCYRPTTNDRIQNGNLLLEESDNLRKCGYEITEPIFANVRSLTPYCGQKSLRTVWIGFIAVCTDKNEIRRLGRRDIVVACRGTKKRREWVENLKMKVVPYPDPDSNPNDVGIYKGFVGFYSRKGKATSDCSAKDFIKSGITRLLEKYGTERLSITVTGHSLGGALATMSAYDIRLMWPLIPVTVFAFASPRVGNRAFAAHMEEIGVKVLRVVVKKDWVPHLPGDFSKETKGEPLAVLQTIGLWRHLEFCHVGTVISLDPDDSPYLKLWKIDFVRRHGLDIHLHLIDGYQGSKRPFQSSDRGKKYLHGTTSTH